MIKVLHINTFDHGGAATACIRIHLCLLKKGIDSKILFLKKTKNIQEAYEFNIKSNYVSFYIKKLYKKITNKICLKNKNSLTNRKKNAEVFSFPYSNYKITKSSLYKEADIIQLNWVSGFLNEQTFFKKNKKPVIWRMADLYACGSGYHYEKYFPFEKLKKELNINYKIRKQVLKNNNITFVPISEWVKLKANESSLIYNFPKKVIHNGVDLNIFKPHNKKYSRNVFNLKDDKTILLFGSDFIQNKRKGLDLLINALNLLPQNENIQLVTFGNFNITKENILKYYKIIHIGNILDERLLSVLYSAADYFIMPSIEEAFGQVTIESMASGTPVISFPNGGSSDIIINGQNGFLSDDFSAESLSKSIILGLNTKFNRSDIVKYIKENFNIEEKCEQYIELYKSVLGYPQ